MKRHKIRMTVGDKCDLSGKIQSNLGVFDVKSPADSSYERIKE